MVELVYKLRSQGQMFITRAVALAVEQLQVLAVVVVAEQIVLAQQILAVAAAHQMHQ
jgi:hypothetical protein